MSRVASESLRIAPLGDRGLTIVLGDRIDPAINQRVLALAEALRQASLPGVTDIVSTFHTVTIYYDPGRTAMSSLKRRLERVSSGICPDNRRGRLIEIPTVYGGEFGPDLRDVAHAAHCTESEVIALHCASEYRVYMLGFLPGFAYMAPLPPQLVMPRLSTPRVRVPAGSVAIAGAQTGIYPLETPGGWRILGRTPLALFDPGRPHPCLLQPGDRVRFKPISQDEFESLNGGRR